MLETKSIVGKLAEVEAENLLVQITEKMELFNANVGSFQSTFEKAPEVFEPVSVNATVNVSFGMVNDFVLESLIPQALIGHERIGIDRATRFDVRGDIGLQAMFAPIADNCRANLTATFQHSHDGGFVFGASLSDSALTLIGMHEASSAADESFVYFNFAARTAHFDERAILHCETDSVKHEPCALLSEAKSAANLVRTNTILTIRNHPNSDKPLVEGDCRILKDGSHFDRELFASMLSLALPQTARRDESYVFTAASGAFDAMRPAALNHKLEAVVRIGEMLNSFLQGFGLFHGVSHWSKYGRNALLSQVYYCPYENTGGVG